MSRSRRQAKEIVDQEVASLEDTPKTCPDCGREATVFNGAAWCDEIGCDWFVELSPPFEEQSHG